VKKNNGQKYNGTMEKCIPDKPQYDVIQVNTMCANNKVALGSDTPPGNIVDQQNR